MVPKDLVNSAKIRGEKILVLVKTILNDKR